MLILNLLGSGIEFGLTTALFGSQNYVKNGSHPTEPSYVAQVRPILANTNMSFNNTLESKL